MVNEALPEDLRDYSRTLDPKGTRALFAQIQQKYPEKYREIAKELTQIGGDVSYYEGSSLGLSHFKTAKAVQAHRERILKRVRKINADKHLSPEEKEKAIVNEVASSVGKVDKEVMDELREAGNPFALYTDSGARGKASDVNQMMGAPLLYADHRNNPVPFPVLNNFSKGLDPAEFFASSFGVRKGYVDIKTGTPKTGYFGKQLAAAAHKLVVSDEEPMEGVGLLVDAGDADNVGSVLARKTGKYDAGTVITPRILKDLEDNNDKIMVHSPIAAPGERGVPRWAIGHRETGDFPSIGDNVGIPAAQALSEPLSQSMISSKHIGGVVGGGEGNKGASRESQNAFGQFERMANIPEGYADYSPVLDVDGRVEKISEAPQGGTNVQVAGKTYTVPAGQEVPYKVGDAVSAGDALGDGIPNPALVVKHKGIGEGRRYFMQQALGIMKKGGVRHNRRNVELMARGLINHVRITDPEGRLGYLPDDIVEYDTLAARYTPRDGAQDYDLSHASGKYLETPTMHYSIGTRLTPAVLKDLKAGGVKSVYAHDAAPEFEPEMQRAVDSLGVDPDWQVRLNGFNLKRNFQKALYSGAGSTTQGNSYIPRLAQGVGFDSKGQEKKGPHKQLPWEIPE